MCAPPTFRGCAAASCRGGAADSDVGPAALALVLFHPWNTDSLAPDLEELGGWGRWQTVSSGRRGTPRSCPLPWVESPGFLGGGLIKQSGAFPPKHLLASLVSKGQLEPLSSKNPVLCPLAEPPVAPTMSQLPLCQTWGLRVWALCQHSTCPTPGRWSVAPRCLAQLCVTISCSPVQ